MKLIVAIIGSLLLLAVAAFCVFGFLAVVVSDSIPETAKIVRDLGHRVVRVDVSELHKAESGVTCMSLVFTDHFPPSRHKSLH
jgi:hypothetical protein